MVNDLSSVFHCFGFPKTLVLDATLRLVRDAVGRLDAKCSVAECDLLHGG